MEVFVAGGSGFIGRALCRELVGRGVSVTAASRSPEHPDLPEEVDTVVVDVTEPVATEVLDGFDAVVNLVDMASHHTHRRSHMEVHLGGTRNLVEACRDADVMRFVQLSGLGVDSAVETEYLEAKRAAEEVVRESGLDWVVYRPSVVFGDGCAFIPFVRRVTNRFLSFIPREELRIQPVWVGDLAPMLADGVTGEGHAGRTYRIGGPEQLTFRETVEHVSQPWVVVGVPMPLARLGFIAAGLLPGVPFGLDQYRAFWIDSTVSDNDALEFGLREEDLRSLGDYLGEEA